MAKILVLGAGKSAPYMIRYLLQNAEKEDWFVTVADRDEKLAASRVTDSTRGHAIQLDIADALMVSKEIQNSDVVVNYLPPMFQAPIGRSCVEAGCHMISASYRSQSLRDLDEAARRHAEDMASNSFLAHTGSDGSNPGERAAQPPSRREADIARW